VDPQRRRGTVSLRNLTKRFDGTVAVDAVDLEVEAGEFISLLGPSGCGKTTTLRMISGFEYPSSGRVYISGSDATDTPPHLRTVNSVFQSYALFGHMTVAENIAFGLRVKRRDKSIVKQKVEEALELVRLGDFGPRFPGQLSGGQQQRVALARAVVNEPDVLLLDEPLSALDLKLRQAMCVELTRLHDELAMTFVFVTHDQTEAITMSDRIAVMEAGRIHQLGTPEEIYERPATRFVAEFIGEVNMLEATVTATGGARTEVILSGADRSICAPSGDQRLSQGEQVVITVRPQRILVCPAGQIDAVGHVRLPGMLRDLLFLGDSTRATVVLSDGSEVLAVRHNEAGTHPFGTLRPGDAVDVGWRHEAACLVR